MPQFVAYYRVSTRGQEQSGLGLEAQKAEVARFLADEPGAALALELVEVQSGKEDGNRPLLQQALAQCRSTGATLLVSKLCRLSRDAAFVLTLMKDSRVRFRVASMPQADNFQLGIWAVLNQQERETISRRTREALAAAKARGQRLGGTGGASNSLAAMNRARSKNAEEHARAVGPLIQSLRNRGNTLREIATVLNESGSRTYRGCDWKATQVQRILRRLPA